MDVCGGCGREMRAHKAAAVDFPGTVARATRDTCASCYARRGGPAPVPVDDDAPCVLVRSDLRPSTYRVLAAIAKEHRVDVGVVLSKLADRAVSNVPEVKPASKPRPVQTRPADYVPDELDQRIIELNGDRLTDIAISRIIGLSQTSVSRRRRLLGLQSPKPRTVKAA